MANAEPNRLLALAEAVADGRQIDWDAESGTLEEGDRELVAQLRLLAGVGEAHRTASASTSADADPISPTDDRPRHWGALEIRERIGAGQFGAVYRAWDSRLERDVALKLLHRRSDHSSQPSATVDEGRLLARVRHPHVITVYGADCVDGQVGIWMELVRGSTLQVVVGQHGPFSAREAALIGVDLCGAMAAVHHEGLVHRDIKAQNVMREEGGRIILMDFGAGEDVAARADGRIAGTPVYMAPEIFTSGKSTPQSDIYSVGVLLFWLVTAKFPVRGRTAAEIQQTLAAGERRLLRDERPDLPSGFVSAVERALARDPDNRYATAGAFEEALQQFVTERSTTSDEWKAAGLRRSSWLRPRNLMLAAAIGILLAGIRPWQFFGDPQGFRSTAPLAIGIRSVSVVPFTNISGDVNNDYFATALAELLISRLGSIKALRVVARSSAATTTAQAGVGSILARPTEPVGGIVTGSVDRRGNVLRVNARLLDARTNASLWAESYERPVDEAFALQGVIARDIAREIKISLTDEERARLNQAYRPDQRAQDNYLRARVLMHGQERSSLLEARRLLEQATAVDPGYQLAYAALARCYVSLQSAGILSPAEAASLARAAAESALAIADNADAELALSHVSFTFDWNWQAADAEFRRALDLNPSFSEARNRFSRFLSAAGRTQEAVEQARLGLELDPLSLEMNEALALAQYYDRQYAAALATMESAAVIGPPSPTMLARIHSGLGDQPTALHYISEAYSRVKSSAALAEQGRILGVMGRRNQAADILGELRSLRAAGTEYVFPADIAFVLISLGSIDESLDWLDLAVQEHAARVLWLRVDPRVDAVRHSERFQQLLRRIGP